MYIERKTFLDAKMIEPEPIQKNLKTVQSPTEEFHEISMNDYQELKDYWLKEIKASTPWYMKGWIRTGGWI